MGLVDSFHDDIDGKSQEIYESGSQPVTVERTQKGYENSLPFEQEPSLYDGGSNGLDNFQS